MGWENWVDGWVEISMNRMKEMDGLDGHLDLLFNIWGMILIVTDMVWSCEDQDCIPFRERRVAWGVHNSGSRPEYYIYYIYHIVICVLSVVLVLVLATVLGVVLIESFLNPCLSTLFSSLFLRYGYASSFSVVLLNQWMPPIRTPQSLYLNLFIQTTPHTTLNHPTPLRHRPSNWSSDQPLSQLTAYTLSRIHISCSHRNLRIGRPRVTQRDWCILVLSVYYLLSWQQLLNHLDIKIQIEVEVKIKVIMIAFS